MASFLTQLAQPLADKLAFLNPPSMLPTEEYEGFELRWKNVVFRPGVYKIEGVIILFLLLFIVAWFIGKTINTRRVNAWVKAHLPFYQTQFTRPNPQGLVSDGSSDFFIFSTGRRGLLSLHTTFTMLPRQDLTQELYMFGKGMIELDYTPKDDVELDFRLSDNTNGFVWAIVKKDEMRTLRKDRWDLTFTKSTEAATLPSSLGIMSEAADLTDTLLKGPLLAALNDPTNLKYFRSLIVTDQPTTRPEIPIPAAEREKHLILSLLPPSTGQAADTLPLVQTIFNLVDTLDKLNLKPETARRLKKLRAEVDEDILRDLAKAKKEQEAEAEDEKKAAKRKAEEDRVAKLSPSEQKKWEEKERKRNLKKAQSKMVKR